MTLADKPIEIAAISKGSWYYYNDEALGNGKETTRNWLIAHPETLEEIRAQVLRQKAE